MKKIISICLLLVFMSTNFSFGQSFNCGTEPSIVATNEIKKAYQDCIAAQTQGSTTTNNQTTSNGGGCTSDTQCKIGTETCKITPPLINGTCVSILSTQAEDTSCKGCTELKVPMACSTGTVQKTCNNKNYCCSNTNTNTNSTSTSVMGISCNQDQLVNGQCKLNIYDTLGIRKSVRNTDDPTSVGLFVQDIVLAATFFIGTLVTVALVVSGLMFIFAASSGKDPANAKKGIMGSLVGLLIVVSSYVIIRLVQYIAKGF